MVMLLCLKVKMIRLLILQTKKVALKLKMVAAQVVAVTIKIGMI